MDKKTKKRLIVLRERLKRLQQSLAGVKQQCDEPTEVSDLQQQIVSVEKEINLLTSLTPQSNS